MVAPALVPAADAAVAARRDAGLRPVAAASRLRGLCARLPRARARFARGASSLAGLPHANAADSRVASAPGHAARSPDVVAPPAGALDRARVPPRALETPRACAVRLAGARRLRARWPRARAAYPSDLADLADRGDRGPYCRADRWLE